MDGGVSTARVDPGPTRAPSWTRRDTFAAVGWFAAALLARAPLVSRIEGALDHDQSVVALMALDIAAGRRFPIFFDGQRYMGAVEAYVASVFVRLLGPGPWVVALAPLVFFGLFAAGQYAVWRVWKGPRVGHLAALVATIGSPMLALWAVIPRGGYIEVMAWALPTLALYRSVARSDRPKLSAPGQVGWGFFLALGYFLNPLSLVVYVTIAFDWTFQRHGADLRRERRLIGGWLDQPFAPLVWLALGLAGLTALAFGTHVDPRAPGGSPYVFLNGLAPGGPSKLVGALVVVGLIAASARWSGAPARLYRGLTRNPAVLLGVLLAWSPFVVYGILVRSGATEAAPSLPVWIAAPWKAGPNLATALRATGPLVGCDPRAVETVLIGQGVEPPNLADTARARILLGLAPVVVATTGCLVALVAWRSRKAVAALAALRGTEPAEPAVLALIFLGAAAFLYLIQGTSPNASSVRYLMPVWVVLPGLIALGCRALPTRGGILAAALLLVPWAAAHVAVWEAIDRPSPARGLAEALDRRGVRSIVAPTPIALVVANLTNARVGALEYQPIWPRLGRRYRSRFDPSGPIVCVTDRRFPWAIRGEGAWSQGQDFERHLRGLAARHSGRVRRIDEVDGFDLWEVRLGIDEVLAAEPDGPDLAWERVQDARTGSPVPRGD